MRFPVGAVRGSSCASFPVAHPSADTNNVTYTDGSVQTLNRRERPKLLFTSDGRTFLYTAAQSPLNASRDFSFTLVQQVLGMPPQASARRGGGEERAVKDSDGKPEAHKKEGLLAS